MAGHGAPPRLLLIAAALSVTGLALVLWAGFGGGDSTLLYIGGALFVISALLQWRSRT